MNKPPSYIIFFVFLMLIVPGGCSVQKNTGLSRTYHNLTARFNVLFNGTESFKKGASKIDQGFRDDYAEILPIFPFVDKEAASLASSDLDRTIKKCGKLISLHSIKVKPKVKNSKNLTDKQREFFNRKEYNSFVDDAYLLMGKAHFYKQEYEEASEIFHLILNDFKNQDIIPETQIWLAFLLTETKQYKDAYEILNLLLNKPDVPKEILPQLYPVTAEYYIKQKDFIQTISFLEKSLKVEKRKKNKTRYYYILAQLNEKTGDLKKASEYYSLVIKMNPVYEMAFNARINRALAFQQGFGKADEIESELVKMLRDDKNIEYRDQIYFALGNLAAKEGNYTKAVEYYKKSTAAHVDNEKQITRSFLTLANLYYSFPDYPNAQIYYDSALSQISADFPGYEALFTKSKSLTHLVREINTFQLEDSVLRLARLPQEELNARIDAIIESERQKEELERQRQQEEQLDRQFGNDVAIQNVTKQQSLNEGSKWYFYNEAAKSMGNREFKLTWGNRKLEDHWQRAVKSATVFAASGTEENEPAEEAATTTAKSFSKMSREYYMVNIPKTDSAVAASLKRLEEAEYNMGVIYKNDLKDFEKSAASFKDLIKRFPSSPYLLSAYYNLYSMARDQNNQAMEDYYKNIIATQFPESMYARVLTNPSFLRELEEEENKVKQYYSDTYDLYKSGKYSEVISHSEYARNNFKDHALIPQFTYLGLLASGKDADRKTFRENLLALITQYPGSEVAGDAQNLINYMDKEHPELKEAQDVIISRKLFQVNFDAEHLFAFIGDKKSNVNQLIFNIINFNLDNFDKLNLRAEIVSLNPAQSLVVVKPFKNSSDVMQYLNAIRASADIYKDIPATTLIPIAISVENFNILKSEKSSDLYLKFFNENYH